MEYIYAAMLIHKAGKKVDEATVKKVLEAAGVHPDESRVKALVAALADVDIEKAIAEAAIPMAAPAAAPAASSSSSAKKEEKKEDKKSDEQAAAGLGALFG